MISSPSSSGGRRAATIAEEKSADQISAKYPSNEVGYSAWKLSLVRSHWQGPMLSAERPTATNHWRPDPTWGKIPIGQVQSFEAQICLLESGRK
jgi:hypothetical protein